MEEPPDGARLTALFAEAIALSPEERAALVKRVGEEDGVLAEELAGLLAVDAPTAPERVRAEALVATALEGKRKGSRARAEDSTMDAADPEALAVMGRGAPVDGEGDTEVGAPSTPREVVRVRKGRRVEAPPVIEGFRVMEVLGRGGMGTVYAGEQQAPRRPVAIKVLHATSQAASARFWAEAEIMARLDHPGIAKVLEAGIAEGHPYFVMERVMGQTLDAYLRKGRPLAVRLGLFADVCEAVHHAHVKGVIHRDLKPSNVMVREDGRVAVLDFGIARVAPEGEASPNATQAGELIGTPVYMSPEQARLRPDEVDARSDVYTLGVMFYEVVSGELPYEVRGKALPDVARAICHDPPRSLARRDVAWRGDLAAIAEHALAKEPEQRYPSAAALGEDVRRHLAGDSISVRAPGLVEQTRRFARRRPGVAVAIGAAAVATAAFAAIVTVLWLDARAARRVADRERAAVASARDTLEERNNQLVIDRAEAAIARDPTEALEWIGTLTARGVDAGEAWAIADEAVGRGVAAMVRHAHADEVRWVEPTDAARADGASTDAARADGAETDAGGFVSGGYDGRALRWPAGRGAAIELAKIEGRVHVVRPSPDGTRFAIGGDGGVMRVVDRDGQELARGRGLASDVELVAWSADGRWLIAVDDEGAAWAWPGAGEGVNLVGPRDGVESLDVAADGGGVVIGDNHGAVWWWSTAAPDVVRTATLGAGQIASVWTRGDEVAAIGDDGTVARWRVEGVIDPRVGRAMGGTRGMVASAPVAVTGVAVKTAAFAEDGRFAILGGVDGRVVRVEEGVATRMGTHAQQVRAIAIAPDGRAIATGSDDGLVQVWEPASGRHRVLRGHAQRVRKLTFGAGGAALWSADSGGDVRWWRLDRMPPTVLAGHAAEVERLALSADGARLASVDARGEVRVWSLADGGGARLGEHGGNVTGVAFAGARIVTAGSDGGIAWWSADRVPTWAAGEVAAQRTTIEGAVTALAASSEGRWIAAGTVTGSIVMFTGEGTRVATMAGHPGGTEAVAFSPDGTMLASGGQDRVVRVWTTARPETAAIELGPLDDDTRIVAWTPDGATLLAAGDDGKVRAWSVTGGVIDRAAVVWAERRGGIRAMGIDEAAGVIDVAWRDDHAAVIAIAAPHGAQARPARTDEDAPWLVRGAPPLRITAHGEVVLATPVAVRTMAELPAFVAGAIGR